MDGKLDLQPGGSKAGLRRLLAAAALAAAGVISGRCYYGCPTFREQAGIIRSRVGSSIENIAAVCDAMFGDEFRRRRIESFIKP